MPIYEFLCTTCNELFEELLRSPNVVDQVTCPACGSLQVRKKPSLFASKSGAGTSLTFGTNSNSCSSGST